jgi:hypothetical protein
VKREEKTVKKESDERSGEFEGENGGLPKPRRRAKKAKWTIIHRGARFHSHFSERAVQNALPFLRLFLFLRDGERFAETFYLDTTGFPSSVSVLDAVFNTREI